MIAAKPIRGPYELGSSANGDLTGGLLGWAHAYAGGTTAPGQSPRREPWAAAVLVDRVRRHRHVDLLRARHPVRERLQQAGRDLRAHDARPVRAVGPEVRRGHVAQSRRRRGRVHSLPGAPPVRGFDRRAFHHRRLLPDRCDQRLFRHRVPRGGRAFRGLGKRCSWNAHRARGPCRCEHLRHPRECDREPRSRDGGRRRPARRRGRRGDAPGPRRDSCVDQVRRQWAAASHPAGAPHWIWSGVPRVFRARERRPDRTGHALAATDDGLPDDGAGHPDDDTDEPAADALADNARARPEQSGQREPASLTARRPVLRTDARLRRRRHRVDPSDLREQHRDHRRLSRVPCAHADGIPASRHRGEERGAAHASHRDHGRCRPAGSAGIHRGAKSLSRRLPGRPVRVRPARVVHPDERFAGRHPLA